MISQIRSHIWNNNPIILKVGEGRMNMIFYHIVVHSVAIISGNT